MQCFVCNKSLVGGEPKFDFEGEKICSSCNLALSSFSASLASQEEGRIEKSMRTLEQTARTLDGLQAVSNHIKAELAQLESLEQRDALLQKEMELYSVVRPALILTMVRQKKRGIVITALIVAVLFGGINIILAQNGIRFGGLGMVVMLGALWFLCDRFVQYLIKAKDAGK